MALGGPGGHFCRVPNGTGMRDGKTEALAKQLRLVVSTSVEKFQDWKNVMLALQSVERSAGNTPKTAFPSPE